MSAAEKQYSNRIKKFYYLSPVCLIPNIGLIVGIILIIYAIFVFKNYKLLFTILIFTSFGWVIRLAIIKHSENILKYDKDTGIALVSLSRFFLDSLVSNLEEYKMTNGCYPMNLDELKKYYPGLVITDPLLERNPEVHEGLEYFYYKKGESYVLFSAGIDGIPNNRDDIYPDKKN